MLRRRLPPQKEKREAGQGMLEFILTLPVFVLLTWMIFSYAMHWWMQVTAATAVHDGVAVIAQGRTIPQGRREAGKLIDASLGRMGEGLKERLWLERLPSHRSVIGGLSATWRSPLSYWGFPAMPVSARSFQRDERFYGGAPYAWE
jgi:hypothetical protein